MPPPTLTSMQGDLRTTSLEQLCRTLDERGATGELAITNDAATVQVWFRQGRVVRAVSSSHQMRIGDRLVHGGLISADDLAAALLEQRASGLPLGEVLVRTGLINRHVIRVFAQEQVLDSLFAAVRWSSGDFTFTEAPVDEDTVPSDLTVGQLLFALESRHRQWDEITRTIPDIDAIPEFVPGADPNTTSFEPGEAAVVAAIGNGRSLEAIAEDLGFGPYEVATVVHGLAVLGLVRLVGDPTRTNGTAVSEAPPSEASLSEHVEANLEGTAVDATEDALDDLGLQLADLVGLEDDADPAPPRALRDNEPLIEPMPYSAAVASDDEDEDDVAPWAFTIEGDDDSRDLDAPQARPATPIAAVVSKQATGTPLPDADAGPPDVRLPEVDVPEVEMRGVGDAAMDPHRLRGTLHPEPADTEPSDDAPAAFVIADLEDSSPEPAAAAEPTPPAEPAPPAARPKSGDMSDLLRELRQLTGE